MILVGVILLIGGIIIGYCCLKKKQKITHVNAEVTQTNVAVTDDIPYERSPTKFSRGKCEPPTTPLLLPFDFLLQRLFFLLE